jgi:hypothetical protein
MTKNRIKTSESQKGDGNQEVGGGKTREEGEGGEGEEKKSFRRRCPIQRKRSGALPD